jgi:hypothetical protein
LAQGYRLIYEIDFGGEGSLPAKRKVDQPLQEGKIGRCQCMCAGTEKIESLATLVEKGLLALVYDHL